MENYKKGRNVEEPEDWRSFGIQWAGENDERSIHYVTGRTDLISTLKELKTEYKAKGFVALSAYGPFVSRVISIAEELKKIKCGNDPSFRHHQYNHISIKRFEEYWDPVFKDDDLEPLCVVREVPRMSIVLSLTPLTDCNIEEPQRSGMKSLQTFFNDTSNCTTASDNKTPRRRNNNRGGRSLNTKSNQKPGSLYQKGQ